jgi:hypothetical protein
MMLKRLTLWVGLFCKHLVNFTAYFTIFEKATLYNIMLTVTNHTLEKLENLLKSAGYKVRYEKGNFKTGACLLQSSRMIVVNKILEPGEQNPGASRIDPQYRF